MAWWWQKDEALFPDLLWSRPENKRSAGKLLIIGGQAGEFKNVSECYAAAEQAGAGTVQLLLPDSIRPHFSTLQGQALQMDFAASNKGGGFAQDALADFLNLSLWADHVLLAGDFGKNSQTTILLEKFLEKNQKPLTVASAALDSIGPKQYELIVRPEINSVLNLGQFQKVGIAAGFEKTITSDMPARLLADALADISKQNDFNIVFMHENFIWVATGGEVVSTRSDKISPSQLTTYCAVWQMQQPGKTIEALATACWCATSDQKN